MITTSPARRTGTSCCSTYLPKGVPVHRTVNDRRRYEAAGAQGADERRRLPVAVGNLPHDAHAARAAAVQAGHLGVRAGFVEKHQLLRTEVCLPEPPQPATLGHVRPILLSGVQDFF
jgi:hypothetical protein